MCKYTCHIQVKFENEGPNLSLKVNEWKIGQTLAEN